PKTAKVCNPNATPETYGKEAHRSRPKKLAPRPGAKRNSRRRGCRAPLCFAAFRRGKLGTPLPFGCKNRKLTIGPYPAIELAAARDHARKAIGEIVQGRDPAREKQARKAAASVSAVHDLVENVGEQFIIRHIRATMRPSWAHEAERMVRKEIIVPWKGRKLSE